MAILRAQATPPQSASGDLTLTFGSNVTAGSTIVVPIIGWRSGAGIALTISDSQGNTYQLGANPGNNNNSRAWIYYAFNVVGGACVVTVDQTQGGTQAQLMACAIEYTGMGAADPLVGSGTALDGDNSMSVSSSVTGATEVAVVAACALFRLNFNITAITIGVPASGPAYTEEFEKLASSANTLAGEADSRVVTDSGAQTATWAITSTDPAGGSQGIVVLSAVQPPADARLTQVSRETVEQETTTSVFLTQIAREVLYPFTCENNSPTPSPTGCPDQTALAPVTPPNACPDEV